MNLILKNLKRVKLVIYKWLTVIDLCTFALYCLFVIGIYFSLPDLSKWIKLLICLVILIPGFVLVIELQYRRKGYQLIWIFLKYLFSHQKYKKATKNAPQLLVPYEKIIGNYVTLGNSFKVKEETVNQVVIGIKLQGFDISLLELYEQQKRMDIVTSAWKSLDNNCSLIKLERTINLSEHQTSLEAYGNQATQLYQDKKMSQHGYEARIDQLAEYFAVNSQLEQLDEIVEQNWYLLVYGKSNENLINQCQLFIKQISVANINCDILTGFELTQVLYNIYFPKVKLDQKLIAQHQDNLKDLFNLDSVVFNQSHIKLNESHVLQVHNIFEYPLAVGNRWLEQLGQLQSTTLVLNLNQISKGTQKKYLEKASNILETNLLGTNRKMPQKEALVNIEQINTLMDALAHGTERLIDTNLLVMTYSANEAKLKQVNFTLKDLCKTNDFKIDVLRFQQYDGLSAMLPRKNDPLNKTNSITMPLGTLGASYPFVSNTLNDKTGLFLGFNANNKPVFFDQTIRDKARKNSNQLVIGTTGSGKSYAIKKELNFHISTGKKVIIIDPEREYQSLANKYDGQWIDVGKSTMGRINPLQVFNSLDDVNENPLTSHMQFLEEFLDIACGGLHRDEKTNLMKLLSQLYYQFKITARSDFKTLKATSYPILQDLYQLALKQYEMTKDLIYKDLTAVLSRFSADGIDAKLWNGHSTIEKSNNLLTVFDLYTLTESGNKRVINAQIFLILKFIEAEVRRNKNWNELNQSKEQWIVVTIDEAHLLIDKKYPSALYFMFSMIKRIRKYNGIMNIITQNINDFVGDDEIRRETTAIINGVQYLKCMQLSPHDLTALEQLYSSYGGISEIEKNSISRFNVGECLFSLGGHYRIEIIVQK